MDRGPNSTIEAQYSSARNIMAGGWSPNDSLGGAADGSHVASAEPHSPVAVELITALDSYVTPCICAVGCLGNSLSLAVLTRTRFRQTDGKTESGAHLGLIFLAVSDMFYCIVLFPKALLPTTLLLFPTRGFCLMYQLYGDGLVAILSLTSTWITVVMALMRYVCICHPFVSRRWDSLACAKATYPLTFLCCVCLGVPDFLRYKEDLMKHEGKVMYMIDINTDLGPDRTAGVVLMWFRAIVRIFIPAACLVFFNWSLIRALRNSYRMRIQSHVNPEAGTGRCRKWITLTLIVIALAFILLVFPSELMDFFLEFIRKDSLRTEAFLLVRSIANVMQVTNFAFNFLLYCIINVHFRKILLEMCHLRSPCLKSGNPRYLNVARGGGGSRRTVTRMPSLPVSLTSEVTSFKLDVVARTIDGECVGKQSSI